MSLKFGTDGIRGVANEELTPELSLALGRAAALVVGGGKSFLVARDTRRSGTFLQAALAAGIAASGSDVIDVGVMPTPGVAYLSGTRDLPAAMISASHNPFGDNGIKLFLPGGHKLSDEIETRLEALLLDLRTKGGPASSISVPVGAAVGALEGDAGAMGEYLDHLSTVIDGRRLNGLHVVLDCANGAASVAGPQALRALGATVTAINDRPDGRNINDDCGSTHPAGLQRAVIDLGADAGLAFDGDADRVLAVDEQGELVDGDEIIGMLAVDAKAANRLLDDTVVVTVMSNLGLRLAMDEHGIRVHETAVGDRYVLEALAAHGWSLGGEQSGHVIFPDAASTGDGILTGIRLLDAVRRDGRSLGLLAKATMTKLPQVLRNVRVGDRGALAEAAGVWNAVTDVEAELGRTGRVLLRPSGTEPLVRVMVEAATIQQAEDACSRLCTVVENELVVR